MKSDEELMEQYVSGSQEAFAELFHRYGPLVFRYMRRGYLALNDADDLVQQTFLQLHRARRDYKPGAPLRPWLMTIARNVKRDHHRRQSRRDAFAPLLDDVGRSDGRFERAELREMVARCVDRLPAALGGIVRERWLEGRSYDEIAQGLGISRGAAKVRAHRACRALRTILRAESRTAEGRPFRDPRNPAPSGSVDPSGA